MSLTVFSQQAGSVSVFEDPALPATTTFRLEGWGGFTGFKSLITKVSVSAQGNYQFLHTLGGAVYVYVFGDRIGQIGVSGLSFDAPCGGAAGDQIGIEKVLGFYKANRIAARGTPMKITIGTSTTVVGYLGGVAGSMVDPKTRIYQFNLQFLMVPSTSTGCSEEE